MREFKERAIAARLAMATNEGWEDFMRIIDSKDRLKAEGEFIENLLNKKPVSNIPDDTISFEGFIPSG